MGAHQSCVNRYERGAVSGGVQRHVDERQKRRQPEHVRVQNVDAQNLEIGTQVHLDLPQHRLQQAGHQVVGVADLTRVVRPPGSGPGA